MLLRKKYYNQIEDMKGKVRVYCRSRPLSKTEVGRGDQSTVESPGSSYFIVFGDLLDFARWKLGQNRYNRRYSEVRRDLKENALRHLLDSI